MFRFFRAILDTAFFPFIYAFRINVMLKQKKLAEAIVASDSQILQEIQSTQCAEESVQVKSREIVKKIASNNEILKSLDKSKK
jgi:hypothetical protein